MKLLLTLLFATALQAEPTVQTSYEDSIPDFFSSERTVLIDEMDVTLDDLNTDGSKWGNFCYLGFRNSYDEFGNFIPEYHIWYRSAMGTDDIHRSMICHGPEAFVDDGNLCQQFRGGHYEEYNRTHEWYNVAWAYGRKIGGQIAPHVNNLAWFKSSLWTVIYETPCIHWD